MSLAMIVYLIGMLDSIQFVIGILFLFSCFAAVVCLVVMLETRDFDEYVEESAIHKRKKLNYEAAVKSFRIAIIVLCFDVVVGIFAPTKETAYTILAASGVETIVTDDRVQQLGGKSLDVIEQWLDEMSPEKEGE